MVGKMNELDRDDYFKEKAIILQNMERRKHETADEIRGKERCGRHPQADGGGRESIR
jgi:hypothetical protein